MTTLSPRAQAVINAAKGGDDPTGADRARVRAAVFAAVGAAAAKAGTAHAATTGGTGGPGTVSNASSELPALTAAVAAPSGSMLGFKIAGGVVLVGALIIGGYLLLRDNSEASPVTAAPAVEAPALAATPVVPDVPTPPPATAPIAALADSADNDIAEIEPEVIQRTKRPKRIEKTAPVDAVEPVQVPDGPTELSLLGKAKRAENKKDWATALSLAKELRRLYPKGKLVLERIALEARVLCKSGKLAAGQKKAAKFVDRWPKAPQARSLKLHCQLDG